MALPFEEQVLSDLLSDPINGGLTILSSGLPLPSLISLLLPLLHRPSHSLLILSPSPSQRLSILQNSIPNTNLTPTDFPSDLPVHHRSSLYSSGHPFFISPRILIADLLTNRIPPDSVSAIIILNAHRLSDVSTESFIARVLRVPVYAFSDKPHAMVSGFAKAERIMKALFIRRMYLWPRFHVGVSGDLERAPAEVVDVRVPMTATMRGIQGKVLEVMGVCLGELRRTNKVDVDELTVENGLFKSFDEIVRRQLDPIWHTIGRKTRQLVSDLRTLRKLLDYLVRYDAVTYLKYLDTLRVSEGVRSVWMFAEASHTIFELAKRRVYQVVRADGLRIATAASKSKKNRKVNDGSKKENKSENGASSSSLLDPTVGVVLDEVLEGAPKWKMLRELLEEIEEERQKEGLLRQEKIMAEDVGDRNDIVLVACKDERTCLQLEDCIIKGPHKVMREEWEKYLLGKAELHSLKKRNKKGSQDPKGFGVLDGVGTGPSESTGASSISKLENDALLAAASEISNLAKEVIDVGDASQSHTRNHKSGRGRGKGKSRNATPRAQVSAKKSKKCSGDAKIEKQSSEIQGQHGETDTKLGGSFHATTSTNASDDKGFGQGNEQESDATESNNAKPIPPVQFYALERDQCIFDVWKPSVIIVYQPDMTFVRQIEVYKAKNPLKKLKVYFLFYENSTEVQKFEASIRRENGAFESLIRQKSLMMMPVDQDGRCIGTAASCEPRSTTLPNSLTRKAGGRTIAEKEMQVIVDMREFNSSLPNVLHQKGMRVIPLTLEVGDYVLSPIICVERKSVADLFQSFASGRLYHQVEAMSRYYKIPVLLIEFLQDRSFSFQMFLNVMM